MGTVAIVIMDCPLLEVNRRKAAFRAFFRHSTKEDQLPSYHRIADVLARGRLPKEYY
jgi:hypothetical protein